jgi:hypothetical protein
MSEQFGNITVDDSVELDLNTFQADGASVTATIVLSDVKVYKDGGTTERTSTSGILLFKDHDGAAGTHVVTIDTSDNTDAGFYAAGSNYKVKALGITVDSQTINAFFGSFSIQNRFMRGTESAATSAKQDTMETTLNDVPTTAEFNDRTLLAAAYTIVADLGVVQSADNDTKLSTIISTGSTGPWTTGGGGSAPTAEENRIEMDSNSTQLAAIVEDTGTTLENRQVEILADVTGLNGDVMRGTDGANTTVPDAAGVAPTAVENRQEMDSNSTQLAAIVLDTGTTLENRQVAILADVTGLNGDVMVGTDNAALATALATAQTDLDTITGADGTTLATAQGNYAPNVVVPDAAGTAPTVDEILDDEVDNDGTAISLREAQKLILSILTAKSSGGGTATLVFRDINDSKNRLSVTVDANGNRTAVGTRDAT